MVKTETVEAICLKSFPYGESSRVTIYWTREQGEIRAMVKGVRKAASKLSGACEALTHNHLVLRQGTSELAQVTGVTCGERFVGIRLDLRRVAAAQMLVEWLLSHRLDPHAADLYDWIYHSLSQLADLPANVDDMTLVYTVHHAQMAFLQAIGTPLDLTACMQCNMPFVSTEVIYFAPAWGGALCKTCRQIDPPAVQLVGVSPSTWEALAQLGWSDVDPVKLQQFWLFLAQHWWHQPMPAHQFWIDQLIPIPA